jgi:SAM-dependent methyltransferase
MTTERVIEIPWCLQQIPQSGRILDVGSCEAVYLGVIQQLGRELHCLDPRGCSSVIPPGAVFHHQSLIGNTLPRRWFDAVLVVSVIEHIGLPCYEQEPFARGDERALAEIRELLKPGAPAILTVPAGQSKLMTWYRQYSPADLQRLFAGWRAEIQYWGFDGKAYHPIREDEVESHDYRDRLDEHLGAGAMAAIVAYDC